MRTCVVAGSQGTNTGAERKRFDGTMMLSSKMIIKDDSTQAKSWREDSANGHFLDLSIVAPPL